MPKISNKSVLVIGIWVLVLVWNLVLGLPAGREGFGTLGLKKAHCGLEVDRTPDVSFTHIKIHAVRNFSIRINWLDHSLRPRPLGINPFFLDNYGTRNSFNLYFAAWMLKNKPFGFCPLDLLDTLILYPKLGVNLINYPVPLFVVHLAITLIYCINFGFNFLH